MAGSCANRIVEINSVKMIIRRDTLEGKSREGPTKLGQAVCLAHFWDSPAFHGLELVWVRLGAACSGCVSQGLFSWWRTWCSQMPAVPWQSSKMLGSVSPQVCIWGLEGPGDLTSHVLFPSAPQRALGFNFSQGLQRLWGSLPPQTWKISRDSALLLEICSTAPFFTKYPFREWNTFYSLEWGEKSILQSHIPCSLLLKEEWCLTPKCINGEGHI